MLIKRSLETHDKLRILTQDSQYDLACACGSGKDDQRTRSADGRWIYPVALPDGRRTFLFKTLISNVCVNSCGYCPLRAGRDPRRCSLEPEETARAFMEYYAARAVAGLFISSGLTGTPDNTMERINRTAAILRQNGFTGYIHLKIMPGSSDAAVEQALSLASAVSLNIETAGEKQFNRLGTGKDYLKDIIRPMKMISALTARGGRYAGVSHTTQFIVGAAEETDRDIVTYAWGLYRRLGLSRVYFSAYQSGAGEATLPGERSGLSGTERLLREHRLYQADWLMRKYGFRETDIPFDAAGNLRTDVDPKEAWAEQHPERFPVNINRAGLYELLRVPGLGRITAEAILAARKNGGAVTSLGQLRLAGKRGRKAARYLSL